MGFWAGFFIGCSVGVCLGFLLLALFFGRNRKGCRERSTDQAYPLDEIKF